VSARLLLLAASISALGGCLFFVEAPPPVDTACHSEDCPGGFACTDWGSCATDCYEEQDCKEGFFCCDYDDSRCTEAQEYQCIAE
jgi:hypothetical protein